MVKKIVVFMSILGLLFIGMPQADVNALVYNGVDYRIMETGTPIQIGSQEYNPVIINEDYGGARIIDWFNYMQANNLHRVEMQAPDVSTLYFLFGENVVPLEVNVFRIELSYDTGIGYFYMGLYGLNNQLIGNDYIYLQNIQSVWEVPSDTRVLTNINFQSNQEIYNDAYEEGKKDGLVEGEDIGYLKGKKDGLVEGEDIGYLKGINETDATGFVALLGAVFGGLGSLLAIELLPGIYIGSIIAVPLVFGVIFFILGKRKGD